MIKLTRLNQQTVVVNPDHVYEAEATPDTVLRLANGQTLMVRESLDEVIDRVVAYRQRIRDVLARDGGHDAAAVAAVTAERHADDGEEGGV